MAPFRARNDVVEDALHAAGSGSGSFEPRVMLAKRRPREADDRRPDGPEVGWLARSPFHISILAPIDYCRLVRCGAVHMSLAY